MSWFKKQKKEPEKFTVHGTVLAYQTIHARPVRSALMLQERNEVKSYIFVNQDFPELYFVKPGDTVTITYHDPQWWRWPEILSVEVELRPS